MVEKSHQASNDFNFAGKSPRAGNNVKSVQLIKAVAMHNNVFSGGFGNSQVSWFAGKSGNNAKSVQLS